MDCEDGSNQVGRVLLTVPFHPSHWLPRKCLWPLVFTCLEKWVQLPLREYVAFATKTLPPFSYCQREGKYCSSRRRTAVQPLMQGKSEEGEEHARPQHRPERPASPRAWHQPLWVQHIHGERMESVHWHHRPLASLRLRQYV